MLINSSGRKTIMERRAGRRKIESVHCSVCSNTTRMLTMKLSERLEKKRKQTKRFEVRTG